MQLKDKRIILVANTSFFIYNFKINMVKMLMQEGARVYTITERDRFTPKLEEWGCTCLTIRFYSRETNPFKDLMILYRLYARYLKIQPFCVLQFTTKPNIYGSLASGLLGILAVSNVSGLGAAFDRPIISYKKDCQIPIQNSLPKYLTSVFFKQGGSFSVHRG